VKGKTALGVWNAPIDGRKGSADRHYCKRCGTPLWVSDEQWPELVHPFASAIDTDLPSAPSSVHLLLGDKAGWVEPQIGPNDDCFEGYPELSIENWHKKRGCGSSDCTAALPLGRQRARQLAPRSIFETGKRHAKELDLARSPLAAVDEIIGLTSAQAALARVRPGAIPPER
jgi:hypothetical protein